MLGEGAFKAVCLAEDTITGKNVAIAKIVASLSGERASKLCLRELKMSRLLQHQNILSNDLVMTCEDTPWTTSGGDVDPIYIVMAVMDGDFSKVIHKTRDFQATPMSVEDIQDYTAQMLRGLVYMHSKGVMHRDMKPGNMMVSKQKELKLMDFGCARTLYEVISKTKKVEA